MTNDCRAFENWEGGGATPGRLWSSTTVQERNLPQACLSHASRVEVGAGLVIPT